MRAESRGKDKGDRTVSDLRHIVTPCHSRMSIPRPVEKSPSQPRDTRQSSSQSVSECTHPPRCSAWAGRCSGWTWNVQDSIKSKGRGCSVAVRPPCAPQTPVRGWAGDLGNTRTMESGDTETSSRRSQSSAQCINTDTNPIWNYLLAAGKYLFLAPTGAQGVTIFVCLYVRPVQVCLEQSIFIFLGQRERAIREHYKRALREHSEP